VFRPRGAAPTRFEGEEKLLKDIGIDRRGRKMSSRAE
jgi:hypothetical protein